ncbi:crossover junction endonuclease MUS81-like [Octopus sinensis]|uniref:Crossover junction endonuclease MUS81 n=1 Tax=Octopus sinensis TaxID=2607531 RepID=A0A6P7TWI0_9MOLL|nr:crossover junction endonuclease MUS81-like [Octopus sinensis]
MTPCSALKHKWMRSLAAASLRKFPIRIKSGNDCKILEGFGPKLCAMVDQRLAQTNPETTRTTNPCNPTRPVSSYSEGSAEGTRLWSTISAEIDLAGSGAQSSELTGGERTVVHPSEGGRIVLYVDNCEFCGNRNEQLFRELASIDYCVTKLVVGDYLWVYSRHSEHPVCPHDDDVVLDFIVERKRIDDLASSIIDGRLHEQKVLDRPK